MLVFDHYSEVVTSLRTLSGVGPKVADCVAMMSCDKLEAVPIDTHVWSVAVRDYGLAKKNKSLTASAYKEIGKSCDYYVNFIIIFFFL